MQKSELSIKNFIIISLLVSIWVNVSEVFRYFVIVRAEMQSTLSMVPNVASMDSTIFSIWGIWDTLLTMLTVFMYYLFSEKFGRNTASIIKSATIVWALAFVLLWAGIANMNLARWAFIPIPLSLALFELVVATFLANLLFKKFSV
jgi:hypothetical protein